MDGCNSNWRFGLWINESLTEWTPHAKGHFTFAAYFSSCWIRCRAIGRIWCQSSMWLASWSACSLLMCGTSTIWISPSSAARSFGLRCSIKSWKLLCLCTCQTTADSGTAWIQQVDSHWSNSFAWVSGKFGPTVVQCMVVPNAAPFHPCHNAKELAACTTPRIVELDAEGRFTYCNIVLYIHTQYMYTYWRAAAHAADP